MTTTYVTYSYYTTTFLGTVIASADFARLALRASVVIDQLTFNRAAAIVLAATDTDIIDSIKMATCAVAEAYQANEADGSGGGIKSESIGSNSVTYQDGANATLSDIAKLSRAAKVYLGLTGLMYPGFNEGEFNDRESHAY
jgi:hypothetical protein